MFKFRFKDLVEIAKNGSENKTVKVEKKVEKEVVEAKEEKADYSKLTLAELKAMAKEQGIKGYSTMKKDELLANLK